MVTRQAPEKALDAQVMQVLRALGFAVRNGGMAAKMVQYEQLHTVAPAVLVTPRSLTHDVGGRMCPQSTTRQRLYYAAPLFVRFVEHIVVRPDRCWEWIGSRTSHGYGRLERKSRGEPMVLAHRYAYECTYGAVPAGLELDHLCRNRWCVNPEHLEAVSHAANVRRGVSPAILINRTGRCARGHEVNAENTYVWRDGVRRNCRVCLRERRAEAKRAREGA